MKINNKQYSINLLNQQLVSEDQMRNNNQQQQQQQQRQESFYTIRWENNLESSHSPTAKQPRVNSQEQLQRSNENYSQQQYPRNIYQYHHEIKHTNPIQTNPPQGIQLKIRSQLIRRTRKYQITTNNAHKKYINCLRNLFYETLSQQQIQQFEQRFIKLKSNRVFFFIIMVYIKYRFSQSLAIAVKNGFHVQMKQKIKQYEEQITKCNDYMLKNYRYEEIHQIEIALRAIDEFYQGNTSLAVEYLYRKDKHIIVKQNHFRASLKIIQDLEREFSSINGMKITQPYRKEHYHRKVNKVEEVNIQSQLQDNNFTLNIINQHHITNINTKHQNSNNGVVIDQFMVEQQEANNNNNNIPQSVVDEESNDEEEEMSQNQQIYLSQSDLRNFGDDGERRNGDGDEQEQSDSQSSKSKSMRNSHSQAAHYSPAPRMSQHHRHPVESIVFPPIPPYFYLPNFDQKYGYLFRRLVYIKSWKQLNNRFYNQQYNVNSRFPQRINQSPPSPLNFTSRNSFFKRKQ